MSKPRMKGLIQFVTVLAFILTAGCVPKSRNLLRNASFEHASSRGEPIEWRFYAYDGGTGSATVENGALKLQNTSARGRIGVYQRVRVWRDTPYQLSVRIKADSGIPIFQVVERVPGVNYRKELDHYLQRGYTGGWKTFRFRLKTTPKTRALQIVLGLRNKGTAWFDDIQLVCL